MRRKKTAILGVVMCSLSLALAGCQDSAQTEEEIVIPRQEEEQEEETLAQNAESGGDEQEIVTGAIAEQVQAPEHYTWEGGDELVSIKVDAPIVLPQGEGFKTWRVESRVFAQEDYDRVSAVLLNGAPLWNRDEKLMEASHGFTNEEIERRIAELEAIEAEYAAQGVGGVVMDESKGKSIDEKILEWEELLENAPDEISVVEVPAIVPYVENAENMEENMLWGMATVDGRDFFVDINNNLRDDWRWINFEIGDDETKSNFLNIADEESMAAAELPREEIRGMAEEAMAAMGFMDFAAAGEEYFSSFTANELSPSQVAEVDQVGYGIYFTRVLEGIPVTYTHAYGGGTEEGVDVSWPYENIWLIYTKNGFADFQWMNPYEVEKESDEYVFLLPWSEIQGIFEEMMAKKYSDFFADSKGIKVDFAIDEVRLGYMRVMEKGNYTEGRMIPVWDFFGSESIQYPDTKEPYVISGPYESWLTVNAMDGTIINREFGY